MTMNRSSILALATCLVPAAHALEPYSTANVATVGVGVYDGASSITNPSGVMADGDTIGYGAVGTNGSTGTTRYFHQVAAFRVSDLLAALGTDDLADLAGFTFTYRGVTEASEADIDDASIYHAAYVGQWEDIGEQWTNVPLRGTSTNANIENMGTTPSATHASRTLFCDAGDAITGYTGWGGSGLPVAAIDLGVVDLGNTAQVLEGGGFDLSGLAAELAGDPDLSNNYLFFSIYLAPESTLAGGFINQVFESVELIPFEGATTLESGTYEVAGANTLGSWGFESLGQSGGTIRFEIDSARTDQLQVTGDFTHTGGELAIGLLGAPPTGVPLTLVEYGGALSGSPSVVLEPGTRFALDATDLGSGSDDAIRVTFGGAAKSLVWTGDNGGAWDLDSTVNWEEDGTSTAETYFDADTVNFDDTATTASLEISGSLRPAAVHFYNFATPYRLAGPGSIGGAASLNHHGTSSITLLSDNTYSGATSILDPAGLIEVGDGGTSGSLGSGPVSILGELVFDRSDEVTLANAVDGDFGLFTHQGSGRLTLASNHTGVIDYAVTAGTLQVGDGGATGALAPMSPVDLPAGSRVEFRRDGVGVAIDAEFFGPGTLGFSGTGSPGESAYSLNGPSTSFTGEVRVDDARLSLDDFANDIGAATVVKVADGGQLYLLGGGSSTYPVEIEGQGWEEAVGSLGSLRVEGGTTQAGPVTLTGDARMGTWGSQTGTVAGDIGEAGGAHALEIWNGNAGADGVLALSGDNSHSGGTTVRGLTVLAQSETALGSGPATIAAHPVEPARRSRLQLDGVTLANDLTVEANGSLAGEGGTTGEVSLTGGAIAPGAIVGALTVGSLEFGVGSTYAAEVDSDSGDADLLSVTGAVTIDPSATLSVSDLGGTALADGTRLTLIDYTGGSLTGTFAGLAEGASLIAGSNTFLIAYHDDSKLTLTVTTSVSAYDSWASGAGLDGSPGKEAGFEDDPEEDGVCNGLEWVLGGDPLVADAGTLVSAAGSASGGLTLVFDRAAESIGETSLFVEWGTDLNPLANSLAIGAGDLGPNGDEPTVDIDAPSAGQVTVTIPAANTAGGKLFARLRATMP